MSAPDRRGGLCKGPAAGVARAFRGPEMAFKEGGAFLSDKAGRLVASDAGIWWRGSLRGFQDLPPAHQVEEEGNQHLSNTNYAH